MIEHPKFQVRISRPTRSVAAIVAFYGDLLGMPVLVSFTGEGDAYSGVIFGLPDSSRQLEVLSRDGVQSSPTPEDLLVFYLGSAEHVASYVQRLRSAGIEPKVSRNPWWALHGGVCFVDPDGYGLVLSPESW